LVLVVKTVKLFNHMHIILRTYTAIGLATAPLSPLTTADSAMPFILIAILISLYDSIAAVPVAIIF
jgi:hypothetical protein